MNNHRSKLLWVGGGLLAAGVVLMRFWGTSGDVDSEASTLPTFEVQQGPLTISVSVAGTIRPREQIVLSNQVEGQTVVLTLVTEGTEVKKGDLVIELDSSSLVDQRANQLISVINAEASLTNARENLEVVKNQAEADIKKAELDLQFGKEDITQYEKGEFPKLLKEVEVTITLAEQTLTNAKDSLMWSEKLHKDKYISDSELKKDELAMKKAELDLGLARDELELLSEYTYKRKKTELASALSQAELALERVKRKAAADVSQAEAQLKAREAEHRQQQDKLVKVDRQIENTKIYAPQDGTVIYASSTRSGGFRGNDEPLAEGQSVRERQELIHLPTTAAFNADIKVHEASLQKIRTGLPVRITIDALPGRSFTGTVASIAPLPDAQSVWMNPDLKVYDTSIELEGIDGLRNGMSCNAEIIAAQYADAVFVPVQAVMRVGGKPTVYVADGGDFTPRPVTIGLDNNRMVHISEGLRAGETVLLAPPLAAGSTQAEAFTGEIPPPAVTPAPSGAPAGGAAPGSAPPGAERPAGAEGGDRGGRGEGEGRGRGGRGGDRGEPQGGGEGGARGARQSGGEGGGEGGARGGGGEGRGNWSNMTPEQREERRKRFESMTPEEREAMRARREKAGGGE